MTATLLGGCLQQLERPAVQSDDASALLRGTLSPLDEGYAIRLCGATTVTALADSTGELSQHFARSGSPSLYVELDAVAGDQGWQLSDVWFVSYQPKRCDPRVFGAQFSLYGSAGDWFAQVREGVATLNLRDIYTELTFAPSEQTSPWRGDIVTADNRNYKIAMDVSQRSCTDSEQQWYAYTAFLNFNGRRLRGCARKGDTKLQFGAGEYSNALSAGDAFVVLKLANDNTASLILDYRNGQPLIVTKGRWTLDENRVLSLSLTSSDSRAEQSALLFQVLRNGQLRQKGYSDLLGDASLRLSKTQ